MIANKKSSILLVLKILEEYTDEEHFLTQKEIADKIYAHYGVELERKSIASSISLLLDLDYDIEKGNKGGFALFSRPFDVTETYFLIDAMFSSRSLSGKDARNISKKISNCFSRYQRQDYSYIYKVDEVNRTESKDVLYAISLIHEAIKANKKISFEYLNYDENGKLETRSNGRKYKVSPYYLVNNSSRYYLLSNMYKNYKHFNAFRVDYMRNIEISEDNRLPIKDAIGSDDFSITEYLNEHIYLFGDEVIDAILELKDNNSILYVKDWFGDKAQILKEDGQLMAKIRCDERALYYWVLQYSEQVTVISPPSFINKIKEGLKTALEKYQD